MEMYHLKHGPLLSVHPLHITVLGHYDEFSPASSADGVIWLLTTNSDEVILSKCVEKQVCVFRLQKIDRATHISYQTDECSLCYV